MQVGRRQSEQGVILMVVLIFALLLYSSVWTFMRRATVDAMIARNRDAAAQAGALARGGVELAKALILDDLLRKQASARAYETSLDLWARPLVLPVHDGASLRLHIEDAGARLNLNALLSDGQVADEAQYLLEALLEKVIEEMPIPPGEKYWDVPELAANLADWIDRDEERLRGGPEDSYYQNQDPPYRAANRPLLSLDEIRLVEGFDGRVVEALGPYVTVYPFAGGGGINPNTAPPWVLALIFSDYGGSELRLAKEDSVREILLTRQEGNLVCPGGGSGQTSLGESLAECRPIGQIVTNAASIYPAPTYDTDVFHVHAEARVGEVRRSVEAVLDRSDPQALRLLSWRAH